MLFSLFLILQIEEVSHLHAARAYKDLALESDKKASFLFEPLILLVVDLCVHKVVAEVSVCSDPAFPEIT